MILCTIETIVGYFVLMFVSTNLVGFAWPRAAIQVPEGIPDFLQKEYQKSNRSVGLLNLAFIAICLAVLYGLFYFLNAIAMLALLMLMVARVPDLMWEIRTGTRITRENAPKGSVAVFTTVLSWGALPVLWFAICR